MKNKREFLRCEICGNLVGVVEDAGVSIVCCNQDMELLTVNTVDASVEKHVPVATYSDGILHVKVGAEPHPQTKEHHIEWITVAQGGLTQRLALDPESGVAEATFALQTDEPTTVYAYCNLHGLWAAEAIE